MDNAILRLLMKCWISCRDLYLYKHIIRFRDAVWVLFKDNTQASKKITHLCLEMVCIVMLSNNKTQMMVCSLAWIMLKLCQRKNKSFHELHVVFLVIT